MSHRRLEKYPQEYHSVFLRAAADEVRIEFNNPAAARKMRVALYNFRQALYQQPEQAPRTALVANLVRLSIDGNDLVLSPKDPENEKISEALSAA